jgi:hypothetical protein
MSPDLITVASNTAGWMPGVPGFAASGFTLNIALVALSAWVLGLLIGRTYLATSTVYLLITIKIALPLSYFAIFADGNWYTGGDDWGYVLRAIDLYLKDVDPVRIWFVAEGQHLFQYPNGALVKWYNFTLFYLFGPSYYAGVIFAPVLSMISGGIIFALLNSTGRSRRYAEWGAIFFLLHWETITWTSFLNLKEPLITVLLIAFVYGLVLLAKRPVSSLIVITIATIVLQKARFYLPFVLFSGYMSAIATYLPSMYSQKRMVSGLILTAGALLGLMFFDVISIAQIRYAFSVADFSNWGFGLAKAVLSPLPWNISEPAGYLLVSATLHMVFLPITAIGGFLLWRAGLSGRIVVLIYIVGLIAYAAQPMVNSPRHRSPFLAMEILMQFEFFYWMFTGGLRTWLCRSKNKQGTQEIDWMQSG